MNQKMTIIRNLAMSFGVVALTPVFLYNETQDIKQYERDPAAYLAARTKACTDFEIQYKVHHGGLDGKSLTDNFTLSSLLTPEDLESCKKTSQDSADNLRSDRTMTGALGGLFGLLGVATLADLYRRRNKGAEPK